MSGLGNKEIMAKNIVYYMKEKGKDRNDVCKDLGFSYGAMSDFYFLQSKLIHTPTPESPRVFFYSRINQK